MDDRHLDNETYFRLVDFMLSSPLGTILGDGVRDALMIRLGLDAGIWHESSRPDRR